MKGSQEEKLPLTWPSLYILLTASPVLAWNLFSTSTNRCLSLSPRSSSLTLQADLFLFLRSSFYLSLFRATASSDLLRGHTVRLGPLAGYKVF
jgi:hypothetical protein